MTTNFGLHCFWLVALGVPFLSLTASGQSVAAVYEFQDDKGGYLGSVVVAATRLFVAESDSAIVEKPELTSGEVSLFDWVKENKYFQQARTFNVGRVPPDMQKKSAWALAEDALKHRLGLEYVVKNSPLDQQPSLAAISDHALDSKLHPQLISTELPAKAHEVHDEIKESLLEALPKTTIGLDNAVLDNVSPEQKCPKARVRLG